MKFIKQISISLIAVIISMTGIYGGYTLFAENTEYDAFLKKTSFYFAQSAYHSGISDLFDDKLSMLVKLVDTNPNFLSDKNFNMPSDVTPANYPDKCGKENVSTYCVAMETMDLYLAYVNHIEKMSSAIKEASTIKEALKNTSGRNSDITAEVEEARMVMDATVKAYNEFRMAYPVHKKFEETIKNLTKYKLLLKGVRNEVSHFPEEFIDATSKDCE